MSPSSLRFWLSDAGGFLAACWPATVRRSERVLRALQEAQDALGFERLVDTDRLTIIATPGHPHHRLHDGGMILGSLFASGSDRPMPRVLDPVTSQAIAAGGPACLLREHWGAYLAFLKDPATGQWVLLRDPSGQIPCFRIDGHGAVLFSADAALPRRLGLLTPVPDWPRLLQMLVHADLRLPRTGLTLCSEVLPGCGVALGAHNHPARLIWNPATFAAPEMQIDDFEKAAAAIHAAVSRAVAGYARTCNSPLVELSGGLDSSIVAACLARAGAKFACVTLATPTADGDERDYARRVAQHLGVELAERTYDPQAVDFGRSAAAHLPRPEARAFAQAGDALLADVALKLGRDCFMSGGGGDNVFCYLGSGAPAADALLTLGPRGDFWRIVNDTARMRDATFWEALRSALRIALRRRRDRVWPSNHHLLTERALAELPETELPPWLEQASRLLPGRRRHIESILVVHNHMNGFGRTQHAPLLFPLMSQPVLETCLRVPTWLANRGGMNRAVARHAFRSELPPEILGRRSKGQLAGLSGALVNAHRSQLRELLLDGQLVRRGYVDSAGVEHLLDERNPPAGLAFYRLFALADVEAWLAGWL